MGGGEGLVKHEGSRRRLTEMAEKDRKSLKAKASFFLCGWVEMSELNSSAKTEGLPRGGYFRGRRGIFWEDRRTKRLLLINGGAKTLNGCWGWQVNGWGVCFSVREG